MKFESNACGRKGRARMPPRRSVVVTRPGTRSILIAVVVVALAMVPSALAAKGKGQAGGTAPSSALAQDGLRPERQRGSELERPGDVHRRHHRDRQAVGQAELLPGRSLGVDLDGGLLRRLSVAPNFTLASGGWTSGAGDCTATLYMVTSNGRSKNLATLSFHVDA